MCLGNNIFISNIIEKSSLSFSSGKTLYVGGTGPDNYTFIRDAVYDANPGDTVFVYSGTYYETKIIVDVQITIIGEDKNTTIVDSQKIKHPFFLKAAGIYLTGFKLCNTSDYPPYSVVDVSSNFCIIENNIIFSSKGGGIEISEGDYHDNIIENNEIFDCEQGVILDSLGFDNLVRNNTIHDCPYGILLGGSNNSVTGNIIKNNYFGMYVYLLENNEIRNNLVIDNKEGIWIDHDGYNNLITENTIISNDDFGLIMFDTCKKNIISYNNISYNYFGIYLQFMSRGNNINHNNFLGNKISAFFEINFVYRNKWNNNYWNKPLDKPKLILGGKGFVFYIIPWFEIDWHPAKEPYDIGV